MDHILRTGVDGHRSATGTLEGRRSPSPPPGRARSPAPGLPMHPLGGSPPPSRALQSAAESPVHRTRASPPRVAPLESHPILAEALPRYGKGESWEQLLRDFPGIRRYLTPYGLSEHTANSVVVQLDDQGLRDLRQQVGRRIEILYHGRDRDLAMECLHDALSDDYRQERIEKFQRQRAREAERSERVFNKEKEFFRTFIEGFLGVIDRFESGESVGSLKNDLPNIGSYIKSDGFSKRATGLLKYLTPEESERIQRAFRKRHAAPAVPAPPGGNASSLPKLSGALLALQSDPQSILDISRRFSDRTRSIEAGVCDEYVTPYTLGRIVNKRTGELTPTGERVIANADARTRAAIRANFKLRFQNAPAPRTQAPAAPLHRPDSPPSTSLFSGFSEELRRKGFVQEPATPQYPPEAPAMAHPLGGADAERAHAPPTDSFFSDLTEDRRRMGHLPEPATPRYPAQSPSSTFAGLSSLDGGAFAGPDGDPGSPPEVTQPWRGDDPLFPEPSAGQRTARTGSPERIDVDALPPLAQPEAPQVRELQLSAGAWLSDEHMNAYMEALAHRLEGRPRAELLNFANPLHVGLLYRKDMGDRHRGLRYITARNDAPLVFLPIHNPHPPAHWSLLVIDRRAGAAFHYDSLVHPHAAAAAVDTAQYRRASIAAWEMGIHTPVRGVPIARQRDGNSCGDHVLQAIDVLAHRVIDGTFTQDDMDLSGIEPNRRLLADSLAHAAALPAEHSASAAPPADGRPAKKSRVGTFWQDLSPALRPGGPAAPPSTR